MADPHQYPIPTFPTSAPQRVLEAWVPVVITLPSLGPVALHVQIGEEHLRLDAAQFEGVLKVIERLVRNGSSTAPARVGGWRFGVYKRTTVTIVTPKGFWLAVPLAEWSQPFREVCGWAPTF